MRMSVELRGVDFAKATLASIGKNVDPVVRGALNATATAARREVYVRKMLGTFLRRRFMNDRMKLKRANRGRMNARIIPSGSGVDVLNYKRWGFDPIDKTRAIVWVTGPNGKKVAAGFVNPASSGRLPWATRSSKTVVRAGRSRNYVYEWRNRSIAMGPSVAYWFKIITTQGSIRWTNAFLQKEFERRIRRELFNAR